MGIEVFGGLMGCISIARMLADRANHHVTHVVAHAHRATARVVHAVAQPLSLCGEVAGPLVAFQAARLAALVASAAALEPSASVLPWPPPPPSGYASTVTPTTSGAPAPSGPSYSGHDLVGPVAMQDPLKPPSTLYSLAPSETPDRPADPAAVPAPAATMLLTSAALLGAVRLRRRRPR